MLSLREQTHRIKYHSRDANPPMQGQITPTSPHALMWRRIALVPGQGRNPHLACPQPLLYKKSFNIYVCERDGSGLKNPPSCLGKGEGEGEGEGD